MEAMDKKPPLQPPLKPPHNPPLRQDDDFLRKPVFASPLLMFMVVLLPVVLSLYYAMRNMAEGRNPAVAIVHIDKNESMIAQASRPARGEPLPPDPVAAAKRCDYTSLAGAKLDDEILAKLRADGRTTRVLREGDRMTMDFSENRVNIEVDGQGAIHRIWCG